LIAAYILVVSMQVAVLLCQRSKVQVILFVACIIFLLEFHFCLPDQLDAWECAVSVSSASCHHPGILAWWRCTGVYLRNGLL